MDLPQSYTIGHGPARLGGLLSHFGRPGKRAWSDEDWEACSTLGDQWLEAQINDSHKKVSWADLQEEEEN